MISISKMQNSDIDSIFLLEKDCFQDAWSKETLTECVSNERYNIFVAKLDGEIVGYAGSVWGDEFADVTRIAVKKQYRAQGIGKMLLDKLIEDAFCRGANTVFLEVRANNEPAIRLYEKSGGEKFGTRKNYYGSGIDALLYRFTKGE